MTLPPSAELQAFLAPYPPAVQALVWQLREQVFALAPTVLEQIDPPAKLLGYGFAQTYKDTWCVIMPLKAGVNLGFPRGVMLPDPQHLLTGTGKRARHVKIAVGSPVPTAALQDLLLAALAQLPPRNS